MNRELPSDIFRAGLAQYPPTRIPAFISGGNLFVEEKGEYYVTPSGALAAGLGWRHGQNHHLARQEVCDFLMSWEPSLSFDFVDEFLQKARWNGREYPFSDVEKWLIELEQIAGHRESEDE